MIGDNSERDRKASEHRHVCRVSMNSSRSALRYLQNPSSYVTHWVTVLVYCKHHGTDRFGDGRVIYMAGLGKLALSSSNSHGHNVLVTSAYSRKASCLSVRFHPLYQHGSHRTDFHEIRYWWLLWQSVTKFAIWFQLDENTVYFTWRRKYISSMLAVLNRHKIAFFERNGFRLLG